jgi:hypothetical protein
MASQLLSGQRLAVRGIKEMSSCESSRCATKFDVVERLDKAGRRARDIRTNRPEGVGWV